MPITRLQSHIEQKSAISSRASTPSQREVAKVREPSMRLTTDGATDFADIVTYKPSLVNNAKQSGFTVKIRI